MKTIKINLLDEDYEKLKEIQKKSGFRSSSDFAREAVENKIRADYRRLKNAYSSNF